MVFCNNVPGSILDPGEAVFHIVDVPRDLLAFRLLDRVAVLVVEKARPIIATQLVVRVVGAVAGGTGRGEAVPHRKPGRPISLVQTRVRKLWRASTRSGVDRRRGRRWPSEDALF